MTPARPFAASVAALGIAGVVGVPAPATGALAPRERAERSAAQSGAEMLRLNRLMLAPARDGSPAAADPSPGAGPTGNDGGRGPGEGSGRGGVRADGSTTSDTGVVSLSDGVGPPGSRTIGDVPGR